MYKAKPPAENTLEHDVPLPRQRCRPSSKLLLGAGARTSPNPASQPIYNAASGLTYPHACEGCMGAHSEEREAEVGARYAPEKEVLADRIKELRRMGPLPLLSELDVQRLLAEDELFVLQIWQEEIQRAWQVYNDFSFCRYGRRRRYSERGKCITNCGEVRKNLRLEYEARKLIRRLIVTVR